MYKIYYGHAQKCLLSLFKYTTDILSYSTRNVTLNFRKIYCRTTLYKNSTVGMGILFWNDMSAYSFF